MYNICCYICVVRNGMSATRLWIETKSNQKGRGNSPFVHLCCMHRI
nr:MAG TPA: hypothetical protein [Caudoviricetes sp.]